MTDSTVDPAAAAEGASLEGQPADPKPTETVEFWKSKAREQEKRAKENADAAKRLADIEAASLSESERSTRRIAELESTLAQREAETLRQRIAIAKGLPAELVGRLQGASEDELSADADSLLALVGSKAPTSPRPDPSQGARGTTAAGTPGQEFANFLSGQLGR